MRITKEHQLISFLFRFHPSLASLRLVWRKSFHVTITAFFLLTFSVIVPRFATGQSSEQEVELSFRAGQAALRQGDFARATQEFKKVLTLDPSLLEAEVNLGLAYQGLLQYDLAVRHLEKALRQRPNLLSLN